MIEFNKTFNEQYGELLILWRKLQLSKNTKSWVCLNCSQPESNHRDNHCNNTYTSLNFAAKETDQLKYIEKALFLLEQLKELEGKI